MKLTESQIQELYAFTRQHFVEHYDLQTELVDHLANDIEAMWEVQPKLSFEDAKNKAFKKFGIFGFMDAIDQKAKAMNKRYMRYFWTELKKWFELPQLLTTIALFLVFYFTFSTSYPAVFALLFYGMIMVWCVYKSIQLNRQFRRRKEISNKKWMLEEMIFKQVGGTMFIFLSQVFNVYRITDELLSNTYLLIGFSLLFTALVLVNYISFEVIPNKAEELLNDTYPEFSM
ncbi:hypothetical protein DFQ11_101708 [Winogradskyella epiphytica]|uniref:Uncharacterized protein n=1 Tax=Winogradskyella epiphytica TaxID=262005 RepID=A0A2V4X016_9FLAO|nr:hypothetical protein [Winogradskyella epiphytica]PYE83276.1 hypothetical protein DFQ11_101708 [Winogradskyella epiphytica]GGW57009.1 hypothetical protein GCM10008085_05700 [Winogradskyella epiphytica]